MMLRNTAAAVAALSLAAALAGRAAAQDKPMAATGAMASSSMKSDTMKSDAAMKTDHMKKPMKKSAMKKDAMAHGAMAKDDAMATKK